jgi:hypothetical protein
MGIEAVIVILLAGNALLLYLWCEETRKRQEDADRHTHSRELHAKIIENADTRTGALEAEIVRLRKIPLTQPVERADNSVIKAKTAGQVREITESVWARMPNELEN